MKLVTQLAGMTVAAALMAAGSLCINASKVDGKMLYSSATVMFLVEVLKGLVCVGVVCVALPRPTTLWIGWRETLYFAAPALLYTIDNNLVFVILRFIDPATLSILWNLKIFTTAVLFRVILRRSISHLQVVSLVLLMLGVATTQSKHNIQPSMLQRHGNGTTSGATSIPTTNHSLHDDPSKALMGMGLVSIACLISSFAGIATEYALKKNPGTPFVLQNIYLAGFSMAFNGLAAIAQLDSANDFFTGYNTWTWVVMVIQVAAGLCMGLILKFLDNIACVFSHAMGMLFTTLVSIVFFSFDPSLEFACGLSVCIVSIYLYHVPSAGTDPAPCHGERDNPTAAIEEYQKVARMSPIAVDMAPQSPSETQDDEDDEDLAIKTSA
ncbi:hypothetical protein H257_12591 [Aphanomyces astaci]|uniref:UDP-galactose transporter n=2 Tax=Aphanomyces astaci TaxID=112090 RepID=W4FZN9_APHAT|nr:hypothetical protein H257_12591 [Aphanomyces astaci]ETV72481.1 hypothetical protein H257_12591 [Aphanomyces astaci]|eukprot:XP_009838163.1 hypothetical protein H257_12591 [Aphanomyces astaci]